MLVVKIELKKGSDKQTLLCLRDLIMNSVVSALQLPDDDRNIRLIEHEPDFFR